MSNLDNMTADQIVSLVETNGSIFVSWRWSDNGARAKMHELVRRGLIKKGSCGKGTDTFLPNSL